MPPRPTLYANVGYEQPRPSQAASTYHGPQDEPQTPESTSVVSKLARMAELQIKSSSFKLRSFKVVLQLQDARDFCDVTLSGPEPRPPELRAAALRTSHSPQYFKLPNTLIHADCPHKPFLTG